MELQTELELLCERCQGSVINLVEKMFKNFLNYYMPAKEWLKTPRSFIITVHYLYDTYDIPNPNHQVFPHEWNSVINQDILESHLDIIWNVNKQFSMQSELMSVALAYTQSRYPHNNWLYVYKWLGRKCDKKC